MTNIWLIFSPENLFHPILAQNLINSLDKKKFTVSGITIAEERHRNGIINAISYQARLWGLLPFIFIALISLCRTILGKMRLLEMADLQAVAKANDIVITSAKNVNAEIHLNFLRAKRIDIIISSCGHIFKKDLLDLPRIACINRHSSLLPLYGGVLPIFWAMLRKEAEHGVSAHYMVEAVDKGDILFQKKIQNDIKKSLFYNYLIAFRESVSVLSDALGNIHNKKIYKKFSTSKSSYFSSPSKSDIYEFKKTNKTFNFSDVFSYLKYAKGKL